MPRTRPDRDRGGVGLGAPAVGGRDRCQAAVPRLRAGRTLVEQGQHGDELFLLFDGVLRVEIDGKPVTEVGPGAIVGEMALLHQGQRMATLRAVTPCRVAVVPKDRIDRRALQEVAKSRMPRPER